MPSFPKARLPALHEVGARILETRPIEGNPEQLAKELLAGFHEVCLNGGLDGLLAELALTDDPSAAEQPERRAALATKLGTKSEFDPRGPRSAKPGQLATCVLSALGVTVTDEAPPTIELGGDVRRDVVAALAGPIEIAFGVPRLRDDIVAWARTRCEERHWPGFEKLVKELDDRGMRIAKLPKVPLDTVHAVQQLLVDARLAVIEGALGPAIARAVEVIRVASPEAAERIGRPVTLRLSPRDVAIQRVADVRVSKVPNVVVQIVVDTLTDLAQLAWRAAEVTVRPYAASQTFAVGETIEHVKFGRGKVVAVALQKIEVEFADAKHVLVHARK